MIKYISVWYFQKLICFWAVFKQSFFIFKGQPETDQPELIITECQDEQIQSSEDCGDISKFNSSIISVSKPVKIKSNLKIKIGNKEETFEKQVSLLIKSIMHDVAQELSEEGIAIEFERKI